MFDANARYLPKGTRFIAGDNLLLCEMMEDSNRKPIVKIHTALGKWYFYDYNSDEFEWLPYQGMWDGTGFIDDKIMIDSVIKVASVIGKPWPPQLTNPFK